LCARWGRGACGCVMLGTGQTFGNMACLKVVDGRVEGGWSCVISYWMTDRVRKQSSPGMEQGGIETKVKKPGI
jgi:hypothetical protein